MSNKLKRDYWGSVVYDEEKIKGMSSAALARRINEQHNWSQSKGKYGDCGDDPEKHLPMPYAPATFRMMVCEVVKRLLACETKKA